MINETRQQIIDIIEPYMNKQLSFGCIIKFKDIYKNTIYIDEWNKISELYVKYKEWRAYSYNQNRENIDKIIWHYERGAIWIYLHSKWYNISIRDKDMILVDKQDQDWNKLDPIFLINKPLDIHNEEEEQELLLILKEIEWED